MPRGKYPRKAKNKTIGVVRKDATGVVKPDSTILIDDNNVDDYLPVVVGESTEHTEKYRVILRRAAVMRLRASGVPYDEIVDRLKSDEMVAPLLPDKYTVHDAYTDVQIYLRRLRDELAESIPDIIVLETQRFDTALAAIWGQVKSGNLRAIETMLKISERRAKMLGLDAAIQTDYRIEILHLVNRGMVTVEQVRTELGEELFDQWVQFVEERQNERSNVEDRAVAELYKEPPGYLSTRIPPSTVILDA